MHAPARRIRRTAAVALVALVALAAVGCGSGDDDDDAAADEPAAAASDDAGSTTTTAAPRSDESATAEGDCPVSAREVSDVLGATVRPGDDGKLEQLVPSADIRERADALCMFSADGGFTPPMVVILSSDDPQAEAGARSLLEGNEPEPLEGVGDRAFADGGELIFQKGSTWTAVLVTVTGDEAGDRAAAVAVAGLVGG